VIERDPEAGLRRVAATVEVAPGTGRVVDVGGAALALFNVGGQYFAVDNACPHRGGPLGDGDLQGPVVRCPWHGWAWDVTSGASVNNPAVRIGCYPVTVRDGALFVRIAP
jgi:nitrite reductase (NADH) small subunit/3-phenylpropionate/trans-cinnamate dioxygenase ferredoxin subunit